MTNYYTAIKKLPVLLLCTITFLAVHAQKIKSLEYFYDTDPGVGAGTQVILTPKATIDSTITFKVSSLSNGLHFLYIRAKDSAWRWSLTYTAAFVKSPGGIAGNGDSVTYLENLEYFFDKDPGLGKGTQVNLAPKATIDSSFIFNVAALSNGLHLLFVRARDTLGRRSLNYAAAFIKSTGGVPGGGAVAYLNKLEYYFDKNPGIGKGTQVPLGITHQTIDSIFKFDISALGNGLHTVYVRAQDVNSNWNLAYSNSFIKQPGNDSIFNISKIEYFFDKDPGFGNGTPVAFKTGVDVNDTANFVLPTSGAGTATLYVRAQDSRGNWSLLYDTIVEKSSPPHLITGLAGQTLNGINKLNAFVQQAANIKSVELQKSGDGSTFANLTNMALPTEMESSYNYDDNKPLDGKNYYRLKVVDGDGNISFSKAVLLDNTNRLTANVYPNPVHDNLIVQVTSAAAGKYAVTIFDLAGRKLLATGFTSSGGQQTLNIPVSSWAKGIYIVEITGDNGAKIITQKIIKQ